MNSNQKGKEVKTFQEESVTTHSSKQTTSIFRLGTDEELHEVAGRASGVSLDGMGKVRLMSELVKDNLLGFMWQYMQRGPWQGKVK